MFLLCSTSEIQGVLIHGVSRVAGYAILISRTQKRDNDQTRRSLMRVKIQEIGKGLHPSEVVVQIQTVEGPERLVIDRRSIDNGSIDVEYPVGRSNGQYLVEL